MKTERRPAGDALSLVASAPGVVGLAVLLVAAAYKANRVGNAVIRLALAADRVAASMEAVSRVQTYRLYDDEHPRWAPKKRRRITKEEDAFISKNPVCLAEAYVGYDDQIHPDYCRP